MNSSHTVTFSCITYLLLVGCEPKSEPSAREPQPTDTSRVANESSAGGSPTTPTDPAEPLYTRDALQDEQWCMEFQKLPTLKEHLGEPTQTETRYLKPAKDQCAYFGKEGALNMGIVAVAADEATAELLFEAVTLGPPPADAPSEVIDTLRAERLETFSARLEALDPEDPATARKQLEDMIAQTLFEGKTYEDVEGVADQAALQTQRSKAMGFDLRYLYLREGNAILMFFPRPQGKFGGWEESYERLQAMLPGVLAHIQAARDA